MRKMKSNQMLEISGGDTCSVVTGVFCGLTAVLVFSTVFAPLAGATGPGCLIGLATGCGKN